MRFYERTHLIEIIADFVEFSEDGKHLVWNAKAPDAGRSQCVPGNVIGAASHKGGRLVYWNGLKIFEHHIVWYKTHGSHALQSVKHKDNDLRNNHPANLYLAPDRTTPEGKRAYRREQYRKAKRNMVRSKKRDTKIITAP